MRISSCFPSKYLKAADLEGRDITVTMDYVEMEDVGDGELKPVLYFQTASKGMILNKTNAKVITAAYGEETNGWRDQTVILFAAMVDFKGESVEALRIKATARERTNSRPRTIVPAPKDRLNGIFNDRRPQPGSTLNSTSVRAFNRGLGDRTSVIWDDDSVRRPTDDEGHEIAEARAMEWGDAQGDRLINAMRVRPDAEKPPLDTTDRNGVPAFLDRREAKPGAVEMLM